jgi:uncharacterized membrane protein YccC
MPLLGTVPVTEVHVTGDNSALYTALAGIGGVVVGAGASWVQQRTKLAADERRLDKQLRAERKRLRLQLEHDRSARELDALRRVLDDASVMLEECRRTLRNRVVAEIDEASKKLKQRLKVRHEKNVKEGQAIDSRIKLWLPDDDPVHEAFRAVIDALNDAFHLFDDGSYEEIADGDNDLAVKVESFQEKARERVGLQSLVQVPGLVMSE